MGRDNGEGKIHVQIQCGLMGTVAESRISDKWSRAPQVEQQGTDLQGYPLRSVPNTGTIDGQAFSVILTSVMREALLNAPPWMNPEVFSAACNGQELQRAEYKTIAQQATPTSNPHPKPNPNPNPNPTPNPNPNPNPNP